MRLGSRAGGRPGPRFRIVLVLALAAAAGSIAPGFAPAPARGAEADSVAAPVAPNRDSLIEKIRFRFTGSRTYTDAELLARMVFAERQPVGGLARVLAFLPFTEEPSRPILNPLEVQQNVVRLRRFYQASGFADVAIDYRVRPAKSDNRFEIEFRIDEGEPIRIGPVTDVDSLGAPMAPPPGLAADFRKRAAGIAGRLDGDRLDRAMLARLEGRWEGWWRNRSHARARVRITADADSAARTATLRVEHRPGPSFRFGSVTVTGNEALEDHVISRELPFAPGDPYSLRELAEGQREVQGLPLVRIASVTAAPDSVADVVVTVTESEPRQVAGEIGWVSDLGLTSEFKLTHRNAFGDARSLAATVTLQPGLLDALEQPETLYRGELTLQQPYVFDRRLSLLVGPFIEYRDDLSGRSRSLGVTGTLVLALGPLRSLALQQTVERRRVYEYTSADVLAGKVDLLTLLQLGAQGVLDSLGGTIDRSQLGLSATLGSLDDITNPRRGVVFRPAVRVTVPSAWNSDEFVRMDGTLTGFYPLGRRIGLTGRVSAGHLVPYGRSLADTAGAFRYLSLRDEAFTAGGVTDVRGWEERLLGPKFPDVRFREVAGDSVEVYARGYVPVGGLSRMTASLELQLPAPFLGGDWGTHLFLDGGKVWTGNASFDLTADSFGQEEFFFATGAGIDLKTIVGAVRMSVGYKLNPSITDLVPSGQILEVVNGDRLLSEVEKEQSRRWQFHLAIGSSF